MKMNKSILTGMTALSLFATSAAVSMSILATAGKVVANENISAHADDQVNTTQTTSNNNGQDTTNPDQATSMSDVTDGNTDNASITETFTPPTAEEQAQQNNQSEQDTQPIKKAPVLKGYKYQSPYKNKDYRYIVKHKKNVTKYFLSRMSKKFKKRTKHVKIKTFYVKQRAYMTQYLTIKAMKLRSTKHIHYIPTNNKKKADIIIDYTDNFGYSSDPSHYTSFVQSDVTIDRAKLHNYCLSELSEAII